MHRTVITSPALARVVAATVTTLAASSSWAHPGHGTTSADAPAHYLTEPLHLALLVAAVVAGGAWVALLGRGRRSDPR